jgi:hypothetical protein
MEGLQTSVLEQRELEMELEARKSIVGYSLEESDFLPHA